MMISLTALACALLYLYSYRKIDNNFKNLLKELNRTLNSKNVSEEILENKSKDLPFK